VTQAGEFFAEQAEILAQAGADLIMLEMMRDVEYTQAALDAAQSSGLPVWVGLSCRVDSYGEVRMWNGEETLANVIQNLDIPKEDTLISIMHTLTEDIGSSLDVLMSIWDGFIGVYAHSGKFIMPDWQFIDMISPDDYAAAAHGWLEKGVLMVGGCCGIGPEHIRVLKALIAAHHTKEA
jgi:S-methylmethionine-dependent homocysteine/selenocysteine methylase